MNGEVMIGRTNAEFLKEDIRHVGVEVLTGMDQDFLNAGFAEGLADRSDLDELRSRSNDGCHAHAQYLLDRRFGRVRTDRRNVSPILREMDSRLQRSECASASRRSLARRQNSVTVPLALSRIMWTSLYSMIGRTPRLRMTLSTQASSWVASARSRDFQR